MTDELQVVVAEKATLEADLGSAAVRITTAEAALESSERLCSELRELLQAHASGDGSGQCEGGLIGDASAELGLGALRKSLLARSDAQKAMTEKIAQLEILVCEAEGATAAALVNLSSSQIETKEITAAHAAVKSKCDSLIVEIATLKEAETTMIIIIII